MVLMFINPKAGCIFSHVLLLLFVLFSFALFCLVWLLMLLLLLLMSSSHLNSYFFLHLLFLVTAFNFLNIFWSLYFSLSQSFSLSPFLSLFPLV